MKQFKYSLETVLDYKTQVLDNLKTEHAVIVRSVNQKKEEIDNLKKELNGFQVGFDRAKTQGAPIESFWLYDKCIEGMEKKIVQEKEQLIILRKKEEKKKSEVVVAKIDTSKFEKLKGKRLHEYHKAEMKEEEAFTEEFVSHTMLASGRITGAGKG